MNSLPRPAQNPTRRTAAATPPERPQKEGVRASSRATHARRSDVDVRRIQPTVIVRRRRTAAPAAPEIGRTDAFGQTPVGSSAPGTPGRVELAAPTATVAGAMEPLGAARVPTASAFSTPAVGAATALAQARAARVRAEAEAAARKAAERASATTTSPRGVSAEPSSAAASATPVSGNGEPAATRSASGTSERTPATPSAAAADDPSAGGDLPSDRVRGAAARLPAPFAPAAATLSTPPASTPPAAPTPVGPATALAQARAARAKALADAARAKSEAKAAEAARLEEMARARVAGTEAPPPEAPRPEAPRPEAPRPEAAHSEVSSGSAARAATATRELGTRARASAIPYGATPSADRVPASPGRAPTNAARSASASAPSSASPSDSSRAGTRPAATRASQPKRGVEIWQGRSGVSMSDWNARQARRLSSPAPLRAGSAAPANLAAPLAARRGNAARPAPGARAGLRAAARPAAGHWGAARVAAPGAAVSPSLPLSAHKRVIKIEGSTRVTALAAGMGLKAQEVLLKLLALGATGVHLNSSLDVDTAQLVAGEFGWSVENVAVSDEERVSRARAGIGAGERSRRAPVVTVMGHVDHGKTTLLDRIRHADVAAGEVGGITQHIGAYVAETSAGRVTFIDTPGHAAFGALRARGARVTDVVVLVVAADDGLMPQTREAIAHAREANVPIVVAINKIDLPGADSARVRRELADAGLTPEAWGGDTLVAEVSAKTGEGIPDLLEKVLLQAELLGLEASSAGAGSGVVIEARLDKGQGPLATVLVKDGTLRARDVLVVGDTWGKVRALFDDRGRSIEQAGPSTPVVVVGLKDLPRAGDATVVVKDVAAAQQIVLARQERQTTGGAPPARTSLADLSRALGPRPPALHVVVKADTGGSVDALRSVLGGLSSAELEVDVVHARIGAITESDVQLAAASSAVLLGFQVDVVGRARTLARQLGVDVREYRLIYELADDVARLIAKRLAPPTVEREIGRAEVRQVFAAGANRAAGSRVVAGQLRRGARVRVERAGGVLWQGGIASLRRFREDVREVQSGLECGVVLAGFDQFEVGDVLVALEEVAWTEPQSRALAPSAAGTRSGGAALEESARRRTSAVPGFEAWRLQATSEVP
jgi:translation initiation factor IF-2